MMKLEQRHTMTTARLRKEEWDTEMLNHNNENGFYVEGLEYEGPRH